MQFPVLGLTFDGRRFRGGVRRCRAVRGVAWRAPRWRRAVPGGARLSSAGRKNRRGAAAAGALLLRKGVTPGLAGPLCSLCLLCSQPRRSAIAIHDPAPGSPGLG